MTTINKIGHKYSNRNNYQYEWIPDIEVMFRYSYLRGNVLEGKVDEHAETNISLSQSKIHTGANVYMMTITIDIGYWS